MNSIKKRQVFLALFLFLSFAKTFADGLCIAQGAVEKAYIERIVDGDTLHLQDGRKVRLVGIDTPELDYETGRHQAYALEAKAYLSRLLDDFVYLQQAKDSQDRYGRHLYYLFDKHRISLTSQLLSEGLGYRIAVPPNLAYQACFVEAEQFAKTTHKGLWQVLKPWHGEAGFSLAKFTVTSVSRNRGGWWLETKDGPVINLPNSGMDYWSPQKVFYLQGKRVEARGWQYQRKYRSSQPRWVLIVRHPLDLIEIQD